MLFTVMATANHWWLDGVVALALLCAIRPAVAWAYAHGRPRLTRAPAAVVGVSATSEAEP
jgi:hypothetical protein